MDPFTLLAAGAAIYLFSRRSRVNPDNAGAATPGRFVDAGNGMGYYVAAGGPAGLAPGTLTPGAFTGAGTAGRPVPTGPGSRPLAGVAPLRPRAVGTGGGRGAMGGGGGPRVVPAPAGAQSTPPVGAAVLNQVGAAILGALGSGGNNTGTNTSGSDSSQNPDDSDTPPPDYSGGYGGAQGDSDYYSPPPDNEYLA